MRLLNSINLIRPKVADLRTGVLVWGFALGLLSIGALWAAIAYDVHTMPGMSGIDVYVRARASDWDGAVLFVSGFVDPDNIARMDSKPFLAKPFRAQVLRDQVAQILVETGVASQFEI